MDTAETSSRSTPMERSYQSSMAEHLNTASASFGVRTVVENFAKYASRQTMTRFLARDHLFRQIVDVHGSIIECGVYSGQGLMSWAQLSSIYEPVGGATREIFGFDTFTGFPALDEVDLANSAGVEHAIGDLAVPGAYEDLLTCIELYDQNRFLPQFPKVHLIRGDFMNTSETFFDEHPHVIPALLYLDFDIYAPTKRALEVFLPRMPKGSIIAFDEANDPTWPGETKAIYECLDVRNLAIKKVGYDIKMSYAIL
jgi:hypothetical protein